MTDDHPRRLSADQREELFELFAGELRRIYDAAVAGGMPPEEVDAHLMARRSRLRSRGGADPAQDVQHGPGDPDELGVVGE